MKIIYHVYDFQLTFLRLQAGIEQYPPPDQEYLITVNMDTNTDNN